MVESQGVLRELQVGEGRRQVRKGLVHDEDEVFRQLPGVRHGLGAVAPGGLGHLVGVIAIGLRDEAVADGGGEVQQETVLLGPPLLGIDADGGQQRGKEEGKEIDHHPGDAAPEELPSQALAALGMVDDVGQQQEQEVAPQYRQGDPDLPVWRVVIAFRHHSGGIQGQKVAGKDDPPPEGQHIVVGKAEKKAHHGADASGQHLPAQDHPEEPEDEIVPDEVQQVLLRAVGGEGVIVVQHLHHDVGEPRAQQEGRPGGCHPLADPLGQAEAPLGLLRGLRAGGRAILRRGGVDMGSFQLRRLFCRGSGNGLGVHEIASFRKFSTAVSRHSRSVAEMDPKIYTKL